ncbi:putative pumilio homolog 7, chloroplastic [Mangifera indica]|uniref:putative pumilio homolog 7, chloroplastic n=1 Tax=Mangifera indica TaxID=29780 RepID=UPI001CF94B75|nr:putative pumilio homolog 7, chloroplastic [Mangifera indica]
MYKVGDQIERQRVVEKMRRDEEVEKMLSEIHHHQLPYFNISHQHTPLVSASGSPFSRVTQLSTGHSFAPSSSCFSPSGFCLAQDNSSLFSTMSFPFNVEDVKKFKTSTVTDDHVGRLWLDSQSTESCRFRKNVGGERLDYDELGLCENFYRMSAGKEQKDHSIVMNRHEVNPGEVSFGFGNGYLGGTLSYNVEKYGISDCLNNTAFDYQGFDTCSGVVSRSLDDEMKSVGLGGRVGEIELKDGNFFHSRAIEMRSDPCYGSLRNCVFEQRKEQGRSWPNEGIQSQSIIGSRPYLNDVLVGLQRLGLDSNGEIGAMNQLISPPLMNQELGLDLETQLYNSSLLKERTSVMPNNRVSVSHVSLNEAGAVDGFGVEDSFIIQGKSLNSVVNKGRSSLTGNLNELAIRNPPEKVSKLESCAHNGGLCEHGQNSSSYFPLHLLPSSGSLSEFCGYIYLMAKDQNGCRFLQRVFDEGTYQDVQIIFNEVIDHVVELMMEQFGNYLVQKLLNVCNEEQRTQIVFMVTKEPGQLVRISLNTYGTRVVQKLIETLKTRQQISVVKAALRPGFLDLIKDLNGNHVLQRCLQCLSNEDNEFIFDSAAKYCVEIATHQHGCCVLQRCIAHSIGELRDKLITEVSNHGLPLAQDPFGNYVVQYIIELKIPSVTANLLSQFKGRYVHLSKQKFSSHVVEKCLKHFVESRSQIVHELLSVPHFEQLLQDPFANYVIQSALTVTKGPLHSALLEAARPHSFLRTSPYCKRIFSRNLSKK